MSRWRSGGQESHTGSYYKVYSICVFQSIIHVYSICEFGANGSLLQNLKQKQNIYQMVFTTRQSIRDIIFNVEVNLYFYVSGSVSWIKNIVNVHVAI